MRAESADRFVLGFFPVKPSKGRRGGPAVELLSFERLPADTEAARALRLHAGDAVLQFENRLLLQGSPVIHERLALPAAAFKGLSEKRLRDWPGTLYQLYQAEFGITVVR